MSNHFLSVLFFIINTMIVLLFFKPAMTRYLLSYLYNTSLLKQSNMNPINHCVMQKSGLTLNSCVLQLWEKQYTKVQQLTCPAVHLLNVMTSWSGSHIIPNNDTLTKSFYLLGTDFWKCTIIESVYLTINNVNILNNYYTSVLSLSQKEAGP